MLQKAGIEKKISPPKLRHTYATHRLDAGAELVDIKALLGHESVATPPMDTTAGWTGWSRGWQGCENASRSGIMKKPGIEPSFSIPPIQ